MTWKKVRSGLQETLEYIQFIQGTSGLARAIRVGARRKGKFSRPSRSFLQNESVEFMATIRNMKALIFNDIFSESFFTLGRKMSNCTPSPVATAKNKWNAQIWNRGRMHYAIAVSDSP